MLIFLQHELAQAADEGVRQLIEQTDGEVSATEKAAAMKVAASKKAEALHKKMSKLVCVANPELTDAWLREVFKHLKGLISLFKLFMIFILTIFSCGSQIARHYTLNSIAPEFNLEKLQLIATAKASPASKIKWLEYFNSSASTCEARRLPIKPTNEEKLHAFLSKACFWEGVST